MTITAKRVVARYLSAATVRLDPKIRRKANAALDKAGFGGRARFEKPGIGLSAIASVLNDFGIEFDDIVDGFLLNQPDGTTRVRLALSNPEDSMAPTPIGNSLLQFSWHEMEKYKFEITAYLS